MSRLFVLACVVALVAAGCGASTHTSATTTTQQTGALAFARCMRAHGIAGWPDPTAGGVFDKSKLVALNLPAARVRRLEEGPCKGLLPDAGPPTQTISVQAKVADGLSFARCMRGHGVHAFPDPTAQGQLTVEMVQAQGIDIHSPQVLHVVQTCLPASHGALTPAKVRQALSHVGG